MKCHAWKMPDADACKFSRRSSKDFASQVLFNFPIEHVQQTLSYSVSVPVWAFLYRG